MSSVSVLRSRDFRLYLTGQAISVIGTWMQRVAQVWLVASSTRSGLLIGTVVAAQFMPTLVLAPLGGLIADRFPRKRILIVTQSAAMIPAIGLFLASMAGQPNYPVILVAVLMLGIINAADVPARQAYAVNLVGQEHVAAARALSSMVFNLAAVIGPATAGLIIADAGTRLCFLLNAVSYVAAVVSLRLIRAASTAAGVTAARGWRQLRAGLSFARRDSVAGVSLLGLLAYSLLAMQPATLFPLFAQVLGRGADGYGILIGSEGLGALIGALLLAAAARRLTSGKVVLLSVLVSVAALELVSVSRTFWLSAALLVVAGFSMTWVLLISATRIQLSTPEALQGRVMALYAQVSPNGAGSLSSLAIGAMATAAGAPAAMAIATATAGAAFAALAVMKPSAFGRSPSQDDRGPEPAKTRVAELKGAG